MLSHVLALGVSKTIVFLLVLSLLIVTHEWGHFIVARRSGVVVIDFAVGMGPTLWKWTSPRSGTNYRLNALPIGGYCLLKGEHDAAAEADPADPASPAPAAPPPPDSMEGKSAATRAAILFAGPLVNLVSALVLLFAAFLLIGVPVSTPTIASVGKDTPAAKAHLVPGDRLVAIGGTPIRATEQATNAIRGSHGKPVELLVAHGGARRTVQLVPVLDKTTHTLRIGVAFATTFQPADPGSALQNSFATYGVLLGSTVHLLASLVSAPVATATQLSGPIGMARASMSIQDQGLGPYLFFAAQIALSLGIFNLFPIPALDGGRLLVLGFESLSRRRLSLMAQLQLNLAGFAVVIVLMVAVAIHDVQRAITNAPL